MTGESNRRLRLMALFLAGGLALGSASCATGSEADRSADASAGGDGDGDADGDADADSDSGGDGDAGADGDGGADIDGGSGGAATSGGPAECIPYVYGWDPDAAAYEAELLRLINQHRASGYDCPEGHRDPAAALSMDPEAQCAARVHSKWMGTTGAFDHDSPGGPLGTAFDERLSNAGFTGGMPWGENIAWGQASPAAAVAAWMGSEDGHCGNIMNSAFARAGAGYFAPSGHQWTLDLGGP